MVIVEVMSSDKTLIEIYQYLLYFTVLFFTVLYCTVFFTVLYCTVFTVLVILYHYAL